MCQFCCRAKYARKTHRYRHFTSEQRASDLVLFNSVGRDRGAFMRECGTQCRAAAMARFKMAQQAMHYNARRRPGTVPRVKASVPPPLTPMPKASPPAPPPVLKMPPTPAAIRAREWREEANALRFR